MCCLTQEQPLKESEYQLTQDRWTTVAWPSNGLLLGGLKRKSWVFFNIGKPSQLKKTKRQELEGGWVGRSVDLWGVGWGG